MDPVIVRLDESLRSPFCLKKYGYTIEDIPKHCATAAYNQVYTSAIPLRVNTFVGCVFKIRTFAGQHITFENRTFAGCYFTENPKYTSFDKCRIIFCDLNGRVVLSHTDIAGASGFNGVISSAGSSYFGIKLIHMDGSKYYFDEHDVLESEHVLKLFGYLNNNHVLRSNAGDYTASMVGSISEFLWIRKMSILYLETHDNQIKERIKKLNTEEEGLRKRLQEIAVERKCEEEMMKRNALAYCRSVYGFAMMDNFL